MTPPAGEGSPDAQPSDKKAPEQSMLNQATLIVSLPADAKLFIQDQAMTTTGESRTFISPALPVGKSFVYTLKVEVVREGKPLTVSRDVTVRAGETVQTSFEMPVAVAAN
ncbi:MAG TPA: TIGR03000 domain-containing protein [Gemmatales bacterium]|nr:TIGR03000 domain-containing protein [Gemmatales bacterium]HMP59496.1 TIGR03000 domain-containing protein [Gemmatales bacterium]